MRARMIPKDVLDGQYAVLLDGLSMPPSMWKELPISSDTALYLYLTCTSGSHKIWIMGITTVTEFLAALTLPAFTLITLLAAVVYRKKASTR